MINIVTRCMCLQGSYSGDYFSYFFWFEKRFFCSSSFYLSERFVLGQTCHLFISCTGVIFVSQVALCLRRTKNLRFSSHVQFLAVIGLVFFFLLLSLEYDLMRFESDCWRFELLFLMFEGG